MENEITKPTELIIDNIYVIRDQKVMIDRDLAHLYNVETRRLKEQVRRNINRFPKEFMFELTSEENSTLRSQFATLKRGKHSKYAPFAFTEYGILKLSSVLKSDRAIQIIKAFVQLRKIANNNEEILLKIRKMEAQTNKQVGEIYDVLQ